MGLFYNDTPVNKFETELTLCHGVKVFIKREDLNHREISGNKWWKLKYNLLEARNKGFKTVLTFGGAFSNHVYSTAAAARELGFKCIAVIRGEETLPLNPTLSFARATGAQLEYVTRLDYKKKTENDFIDSLRERYGEFYLIPEGGTNTLAVKGCKEFGESISDIPFDMLYLPVGTGGTISGLIAGLKGKGKIFGIPVFKQGDFLREEIKNLLLLSKENDPGNWDLLTQYHHGGYAKTTPALISMMKELQLKNQLPLDQVYTAKMVWALLHEIENGSVRPGTSVLLLHTGGLQGSVINE